MHATASPARTAVKLRTLMQSVHPGYNAEIIDDLTVERARRRGLPVFNGLAGGGCCRKVAAPLSSESVSLRSLPGRPESRGAALSIPMGPTTLQQTCNVCAVDTAAMTTRSEREKAQKLNEQHQAILAALLREEDNKYCADCEAKGPRWASWNLGVFICIRCAGIHRNLGVHIARVKSVNLDQWTSEQIQHMQDMGNGKAKKLYEGFLPKDFRRPVSDQAAEAFIRDKYDKKRYMDRNADMSSPKVSSCTNELPTFTFSLQRNVEKDKEKDKKDKKKKENKSPAPEKSQPKPQEQQSMGTPAVQTAAEPAIDLLGLESPTAASNGDAQSAAPASEDQDIFGPMVSNPLPQSTQAESCSYIRSRNALRIHSVWTWPDSTPIPARHSGKKGLAHGASTVYSDASPASSADDAVKRQLSKDSILSLYASQPPPPATAAVNSQGVFGYGQPGMAFPGPAGVYSAQAISGVGVGGGGVGMPPGVPPPGCTSAVGNPNPNPMQWGLGQMTEQMSGLGLVPAGVMVGDVLAWPPGASGGPGCPAPPAAGRTLSTQLWK
ncbi:unnamed protein product [Lampetra fluviatilis]